MDTELDSQQAPPSPRPLGRLAAGTHVGRYVLLDALGEGGMGVVYRAHDPSLDRVVALKLLKTTARPSGEALTRFEREAQAMARLNHPNVVTVFDFGVHEQHAFLVMELVDGTSMRGWLSARRRTQREVVAVVADAARGLAAAHGAGVVHRDVKPENILLGSDGRVMVTDFGLASSIDLGAALTGEGVLMGTPAYMSPEQLEGTGTDARTDEFALGVVLAEACYGQRPFQAAPGAASPFAAQAKALQAGPPLPPPGVKVPRALQDVINRMLSTRPEGRFATLLEVVAALQALERPQRRGRWVAAAGLLVLVLAVMLGAAKWGARSAAEPSRNAEALAHFREGVRLWRAGSSEPARRALEEATRLDPDFTAAFLWLALVNPDPGAARAALTRARLAPERLDDDARMLIEPLAAALAPMPDLEAALKIDDAAIQTHPSSALLRVLRARTHMRRGDAEAALADLEVARTRDPSLTARSWAMRATTEVDRYAPDAARAAVDACLDASPLATDCLRRRSLLRGNSGDCQGMEADARAWIAQDPDEPEAWELLAEALHATGAPWPSIEEAYQARRARLPAQRSHWLDDLRLDFARGDFAGAEAVARTELEQVPAGVSHMDHVMPAFELVLALREQGRDAEAGEVCLASLARARAWAPETLRDMSMLLLFVQTAHLTGAMNDETYQREHQHWLDAVDAARARMGGTSDPYSRAMAWVVGYAAGTHTEAAAKRAMEALPRYAPLPPPGMLSTDIDLVIGTVFRLAGDVQGALPYARASVRSCRRLENPPAWVYGQLNLGLELEALGQRDEAIAHYREVLSVWGHATPASQTAARATSRLAALGVPP